jgi:hypothetical protein
MWKCVFLGDKTLYLTNNRSNLNVTLTIMNLNICKENIFFCNLEIRSLLMMF